jgi:hypothetical protein
MVTGLVTKLDTEKEIEKTWHLRDVELVSHIRDVGFMHWD